MVDKVLMVVACVALTFAFACSRSKTEQNLSNPTPSPVTGTPAALQSNQSKGKGMWKALNPNAPSIKINQVIINGFMPARQMEFPVIDANLLNGWPINDASISLSRTTP